MSPEDVVTGIYVDCPCACREFPINDGIWDPEFVDIHLFFTVSSEPFYNGCPRSARAEIPFYPIEYIATNFVMGGAFRGIFPGPEDYLSAKVFVIEP